MIVFVHKEDGYSNILVQQLQWPTTTIKYMGIDEEQVQALKLLSTVKGQWKLKKLNK